MSNLAQKLNQAEAITKKILEAEEDLGSEGFILKLISALRKALEQRNELIHEIDPTDDCEDLDAEILQILEGEE